MTINHLKLLILAFPHLNERQIIETNYLYGLHLADDASDGWCSVLALCVMLPVQSSDEAAAVLWRMSWSPRGAH